MDVHVPVSATAEQPFERWKRYTSCEQQCHSPGEPYIRYQFPTLIAIYSLLRRVCALLRSYPTLSILREAMRLLFITIVRLRIVTQRRLSRNQL